MSGEKKLLAIDTANANFSLAVFSGSELVELYISDNAGNQAEMLVPEIEAILARHNLLYSVLDYIAVNVGPGSFTGLRIGISAVKAYGLILPAQLIGITSLQAVALREGGGNIFLDARRGQAFQQNFNSNGEAISAPELVDYAGKFHAVADAEWIGKTALKKIDSADLSAEICPVYIRPADAKLPKTQIRSQFEQ